MVWNYSSIPKLRDNSGYGLSQWEMMLHCIIISYWLHPFLEQSLKLQQCSGWCCSVTDVGQQLIKITTMIFIQGNAFDNIIKYNGNVKLPIVPTRGLFYYQRLAKPTFNLCIWMINYVIIKSGMQLLIHSLTSTQISYALLQLRHGWMSNYIYINSGSTLKSLI